MLGFVQLEYFREPWKFNITLPQMVDITNQHKCMLITRELLEMTLTCNVYLSVFR